MYKTDNLIKVMDKMNTSEERRESVPKYLSETVYKEMAKSLKDFKNDTVTTGDNLNMAAINQTEPQTKHHHLAQDDSKAKYSLPRVYYLKQVNKINVERGREGTKIQGYQEVVNHCEGISTNGYERKLVEKAGLSPKEEYNKGQMGPYHSKCTIEGNISPDILNCVSSPETSPNLIASSQEKYKTIKTEKRPLEQDTEEEIECAENQQNSPGGQHYENQYNQTKYNYGSINFTQYQNEKGIPSQGYLFPLNYNQHILSNSQIGDSSHSFAPYKPTGEVCYFNSINPVYDEKTKSYFPNYQVVNEEGTNMNYRHPLLRNDQIKSSQISPMFKYISSGPAFNIPDLYEDPESFYKNSNLKGDVMEGSNDLDSMIHQRSVNQHIASKGGKEKRRGEKSSTAGRPRLNRNHYSCSNCHAKTTPQWRYINGVPVCNACYMRMRKDLTHYSQSGRGKPRRKQQTKDT